MTYHKQLGVAHKSMEETVVRKKKTPLRTVKVRVPLVVEIRGDKTAAYCMEVMNACEWTKKGEEHAEKILLDDGFGADALQFVWVEAQVPVPRKPVATVVKGRVIATKKKKSS